MRQLIKRVTTFLSKQQNKKFFLVVSEYPKSGGTWLTTLIGDTLNYQKRDIYLTKENLPKQNNYLTKNIFKHPWYSDAKTLEINAPAIIKSHELPNSPLIKFKPHYIHLIRDGRDIVVSKYFYEKEFCLKNNVIDEFNTPFDEYLEKTALAWKQYISTWQQEKNILTIKYEDLLLHPETILGNILKNFNLEFSAEKATFAITDNTKEKFSEKLIHSNKHNTFVRKAISGDWKNHFTTENKDQFKKIAGDMLIKLGYEKDNEW